MGLDCSHDAFSGAYSAFNRLRQEVARAMGGSYPPHFKRNPDGTLMERNGRVEYNEDLDPESWYWGEGYSADTHPGLMAFLAHSDCDGEISPEMCVKVADELEALIPAIEKLGEVAVGHLAQLGYVGAVRRFIAGCRAASAANEPLTFH